MAAEGASEDEHHGELGTRLGAASVGDHDRSTAALGSGGSSAPTESHTPSMKRRIPKNIEKLRDARLVAQNLKNKLTKDLRNATRRNTRLKKRTRQLTNDDLLEVIQAREDVRMEALAEDEAARAAVVAGIILHS